MNWTRGPTIGRGSTATVSVATTVTGNLLAVKSTDLSTSQLLQKEQHILSQLTSKHVIKYMGFDINYHHNKPMYNLFMEYATGGSVHDVIKKSGGSLHPSLIRSYTYQVLLGLDYLHCNNIVHCDIKCRNLLLCQEDGVKIADLGCAKLAGNNNNINNININNDNNFEFSGTPVFMSPEVARGESQGFAADVWAVGCSVIEMATGFTPWREMDDPVAVLYRIGYSGDLPEYPKCLPEDGKDFLEKCFKKDVEERWTVKELLQHPFVRNLSSGGSGMRNSPTSTLDQGGFWECFKTPERMVGFSGEGPVERIRQLGEASSSGLPDWDDEGGWIAVRGNRIEEMSVDDGEVEEIESLVVDEDYMMLECCSLSRVFDLDHIVNDSILVGK